MYDAPHANAPESLETPVSDPGRRIVLRRDMAALRTSPARILRRYDDQFTAIPRQLVLQLAAELEPTLIEDGSVQAGLGAHMFAWSFD